MEDRLSMLADQTYIKNLILLEEIKEENMKLENQLVDEFRKRYRYIFKNDKAANEAWYQDHGFKVKIIGFTKDDLTPDEDSIHFSYCWTGRGSVPNDWEKVIYFKSKNLYCPLEKLTKQMFIEQDY
jgi:hypothetical protein